MDSKQLEVYRRWDDGFLVRRMKKGEELKVIRWFGALGAMSNKLEVVMSVSEDHASVGSFYTGELNGEMVASLMLTSIADDLKYIAAVYVDDRHRGSGFAQRLLTVAHDIKDWNGTIVLDAYQHLVSMYEKFGYKSAYKTSNYEGTVSANGGRDKTGTDVREVIERAIFRYIVEIPRVDIGLSKSC